jgi:hypothetical protein
MNPEGKFAVVTDCAQRHLLDDQPRRRKARGRRVIPEFAAMTPCHAAAI